MLVRRMKMKYIFALILSLSITTAHAGLFGGIGDAFGKTGIFHKKGNGRNNLPILDMYDIPPDAIIDFPENGELPKPDQHAPIPLPAAFWLFLSGVIGLICVARKK